MEDIRVRPAVLSDIPSIQAILLSCRDELPQLEPDSLTALLARNVRRGSTAVAELSNKAIGVCVWSPPLSRISLLAVMPEARGMGAASRLMETALTALPGQEVTVETFTEADPRGRAARTLYHKFGFLPEQLLSGYDTPMEQLKLRRG